MTFLEILTNLSRIITVYELWKTRINNMNLGQLTPRQMINKTLRLLEFAATNPELDKIINERFKSNQP